MKKVMLGEKWFLGYNDGTIIGVKMEINQQFDDWIEVKKEIHKSNRVQATKEGEIWWCAMGENVGVEINGKSRTFARPVLIFKKCD